MVSALETMRTAVKRAVRCAIMSAAVSGGAWRCAVESPSNSPGVMKSKK